MNFFTVIIRGLMRRPVRTGLTLLGISIGIAAVVALVGISRGFETSWTNGMKMRQTDMVISGMGNSLMPKTFDEVSSAAVAKLPNVAAVCSLLVEPMSVEDAEMIFVSAREWGGFSWDNLKVLEGRLPLDGKEEAVVLGKTAAEILRKKVGDPLLLEAAELKVVGIVDGGALVENGSVILALPRMQEISGNQGKINIIDVRLKPNFSDAEVEKLKADIKQAIPKARAEMATDHIHNSQAYKMISAMSWGTSLLAVLVGVLGVMNTMLMTVFERKQEISILLAIGWKKGRVVRMILLESAMLGLLGGIVGVAIGVAGVKILETTPAIKGLLEPDLNIRLLISSVIIAVVVGVVSGLYPAWRSSRLTPSLALQG